VAREVALEHAGGVACAFSLCDVVGDVVAGRGVVLSAVKDDRVQGAVELAVAAAADRLLITPTAGA
jgi:hypothetical protein